MLRLTEIGLVLVPFALYVTWLVAGARTPRWAVWATVVRTVAMAAGTVGFGLINAIPPDSGYAPAEVIDGVIVPGPAVAKPRP